MRFRTLLPLAASVLALLATSTGSAQGTRTVNVLCSAGTEYCEVLARNYQRATGAAVSMVAKSTGEALAQITAERNNPRTDLWYGGTGDPHLQAAESGLLDEYRSARLGELHDWAVNQANAARHRTVGVYLGPLGFSYNRALLAPVQEQTHTESKSPQYSSNRAAPLYAGMPRLNEIKFIDYDFVKYGSVTVRKALLARWDKEIGSLRE